MDTVTNKRRRHMDIIVWIIIGALAGWIASLIMNTDQQMGAVANIIAGIVGAFVGGWVIGLFNLSTPEGPLNIPSILTAILGAVIVIGAVKLVTGAGDQKTVS